VTRPNCFPYLKAIAIALAVVAIPYGGVEFVLLNHALDRGSEELNSAATRYVQRADSALSEALYSLKTVQEGGFADCRGASRQALANEVQRSEHIRTIGIVDANGLAMCMEPGGRLATATLLPPYQKDSPTISIGIVEDANGVRSAIAGLHIGNGDRLIARLSQETLAIDAGPDYLRQYMQADVRLSDGSLWYRNGRLEEDVGEEVLAETVRSTQFPLRASVTAPRSAVRSLVRELDIITTIGAFGALIVIALFVLRMIRQQSDLGIIGEIDAALKRKEFEPYYQPLMDIESGHLLGCEALARWVRKDGTVVSPAQFIPVAEASGQIFEITLQLMEKVNTDLAELYRTHPELKVSVNLAAGHLNTRKIVDDVKRIFGKGPIRYEQLVFEVTERQQLSDVDGARRILAELRSLGAKTALDDVGTGHSGLAYLQKLGVDIVKIDKIFIDPLSSDRNSNAIVDKLVGLAESLEMGIVAEGVENFEQIEILRQLGVTTAQGFLFAPPLPKNLYLELAASLLPRADDDAIANDDGETPEAVVA